MDFVRNIPFCSILLTLFSGTVCSMLSGRAAKWVNTAVIVMTGVMSAILLHNLLMTGESFVYWMGHFPAPWGNEIRAGILEASMALFFCIIMLLSMWGGRKKLDEEVEGSKHNLYYILVNLLLSSLLALIYTNDLFTAYVFVEINTIAACGLIMIRQIGRTLAVVGLAIKSALFPFHAWLPDAYGYSTISSAAILSSLASKGYIFLLIKIIYRVIGFEVFNSTHIINVLFVFGLMAMIFGSLSAIKESGIRRMIAFSSVAQVGYIYMGIGLGTRTGMIASVYHIFAHAAGKALLFISVIGLTDVSGFSRRFVDQTGAGYRNKIAGIGFTVGSLSMVGVPVFAGFISKILFAQAAVKNTGKLLPTMIVLAISTILNAIYFMKTVIRIYTPCPDCPYEGIAMKKEKLYAVSIILFVALNIALGMSSQPVVDAIASGLDMFG